MINGTIVSEGYWDTVNSLCLYLKKIFFENCKMSFSALKLIKSRIIKSIKRSG